ncbi:MAG: hypothetical protein PHY28_02040 [Dehalococcoidales bacterium]|nr:hypothetical protein [Dehalococcoidales bacterium]
MKRLIFICLTIAVMIAVAIPTATMAKDLRPAAPPQRFELKLTPQSIDQPGVSTAPWPQANPANANSWPIYDIVDGAPAVVGWIVDSRSIYGTVSGDATGQFVFTYSGVLDTIQSGSIHGIVTIGTAQGTVYLLADGTSDASIKETYTFNEVAGWCQQVGIPVGAFFAQYYGIPDLSSVPIAELTAAYGTALPLLPKTLGASFSGKVTVESGTGNYAAIHGTATFKPEANKSIILSVYPNQHVYNLSGGIIVTSFRAISRIRLPQVESKTIKEGIKNWLNNKRK